MRAPYIIQPWVISNELILNWFSGTTQDSNSGGTSNPKSFVFPYSYTTMYMVFATCTSPARDSSGCMITNVHTLTTCYVHYFYGETSYTQPFWAFAIGY